MSSNNFVFELMRMNGHQVPRLRRPRAEGDVTFGSDLPAPEPKGRWRRRSSVFTLARRDFTGAALSGSVLAVATVHRDREGGLIVDHARSTTMSLTARDQASVEAFYHEAQLFFYANGLRQLFLREPVGKGEYASVGGAHKIEAVLQLVDMLAVDLVHPVRIPAWVRRERPKLPPVSDRLRSSERSAMRTAIETAAFAESAGCGPSSPSFLKGLLDG